jgi:hypothetical protein
MGGRQRCGGVGLDPGVSLRRHVEQLLRLERLAGALEEVSGRDAVVRLGAVRVGVRHRQLIGWDLPAPGPCFTWLELLLEQELRREGLGDEIVLRVSVDPAAPFLRVNQRVACIARATAQLAALLVARAAPGSALEVPGAELGPAVSGPSLIRVERHLRGRSGPRAQVIPSIWSKAGPSALTALREEDGTLRLQPRSCPDVDERWLLLVTGDSWAMAGDAPLAPVQPVRNAHGRVLLLDLPRGQVWRVGSRQPATWPHQGPAISACRPATSPGSPGSAAAPPPSPRGRTG